MNHINWAFWGGPEDTLLLIGELMRAVSGGELTIARAQSKDEPGYFTLYKPEALLRKGEKTMITELQKKAAQAIVNIFETSRPLGDYGRVTLLRNDSGHSRTDDLNER